MSGLFLTTMEHIYAYVRDNNHVVQQRNIIQERHLAAVLFTLLQTTRLNPQAKKLIPAIGAVIEKPNNKLSCTLDSENFCHYTPQANTTFGELTVTTTNPAHGTLTQRIKPLAVYDENAQTCILATHFCDDLTQLAVYDTISEALTTELQRAVTALQHNNDQFSRELLQDLHSARTLIQQHSTDDVLHHELRHLILSYVPNQECHLSSKASSSMPPYTLNITTEMCH